MNKLSIKAGRILSVLMATVLMLSSMLIALPADTVAFAAAGSITGKAATPDNPNSPHYMGSEPVFTVTDTKGTHTALCINYSASTPKVGDVTGEPTLSDNQQLRIVMYYGYGGPGYQSSWYESRGLGWSVTAMTASAVNGDTAGGKSTNFYQQFFGQYNLAAPPSSFKVYTVSTKSDYQNLAYWVVEQPKYGAVEVYKKSANESITNGNACYSLEGCVIGLYKHGSTAEIGRFTTNAAGYGGKIGNLEPGQYDLKELQAPKGLILDQTIVTVTVEADKVTTYTMKDQPANDPVGLLLQKVDAEGNAAVVEAGIFKGAQYTFEYFDGQYTEAELAGKPPVRTWVLAVDEYGQIYFNNANKVSGDEFYISSSGKPVMPVGTLRVHETKAVKGYLLDPTVYVINIVPEEFTGRLIKSYQPVTSPEQIIRGGVELNKVDSRTGQPLEGVEFAVKDATGAIVATLITDSNGYAATANNALIYGNYTLEETKAKTGYSLDATPKPFEIIENGKMVSFTGDSSIPNTEQPGFIEIIKTDEKSGKSIEGVEFGIYSDKECTKLVQTIITDAVGKAKSKALTVGTYYVKETKAKEGYILPTEVYESKVTAAKTTTIKITNNLIRGGVRIEKTDAISGSTPQGASSFEGVEFTICKITHTEKGVYSEEVMTIVTDKTGIAQTDADALEYGSYMIYESKVSKGLKINDKPISFKITKSGYVDLTGSRGIADEVIRGDIKGIKSASDGVKLAGVPFKITSLTTGESHVIVTDANGEFDTSSSSRPHTGNTNRGESAEDGVWFGAGEPDDKLGALPYDTYIIEELPCEANEYMILIESFKTVVAKDAVTVELEPIINEYRPVPTIHTVATVVDTDGSHYAPTEGEVTIKETAYIDKLVLGWTYDLLAIGRDCNTADKIVIDGKELSNTKQFTADAEKMTIDFYFTIKDASQLKEHVVVFCEYLSRKGKLLADHENMEDLGQSIYFPELHTTAIDNSTGSHVSNPEGKVTHTDRIYYNGAQPGKEVPIKAYPVFKDNGEEVLNDGQPVIIETTFVPDAVSGFIDLTFTFDASQLAGRAIVYCEGWYEDDRLITLHANLDDEDQSIYFPAIHTTATGKDGSKTITADGTQTITDKIDYINFTDRKYRAVTSAMILDDKGNVTELKVNGKPVISETWFNATGLNGSVNVELKFNAAGIVGKVVIYEKVYDEAGNLVTRHENPKDEGQTVTIVPPPETPKTGDNAWMQAAALIALCLATLATAAILAFRRRKAV
ncbi:MAG: VaFE repeat-containing surface-anchored protein [Lachnospiraceae bacterium]|nr:VaFE repeat-containing surface-anchored protein [Lachnospiraceae bacterium]